LLGLFFFLAVLGWRLLGGTTGSTISTLPRGLRDHLFERLRERKITAEDLCQLKLWRESEREAPEAEWYKGFGSFMVCGKE